MGLLKVAAAKNGENAEKATLPCYLQQPPDVVGLKTSKDS
jgi:hypothetical protein